ncbi:MAG TPA: type II secretion system protein [Candidatus Methylacidiphilales bacterium]|nr:type II secretion system protein [Candidatus Methylacidiphilales bacterium]
MIKSNLILPVRVARQRGFTLVELLVVLSIIAILVAVLAPAAMHALKMGRENAAMQNSHNIGELMMQYGVDQGQYPDGNTSTDAFKLLLANNYLTSPSIFYLAGGTQTKFTGTSPAVNLASNNVSWDITGLNGTGSTPGPVGISSTAPDELPVVFSTGGTVSYPAQPGPGSATCTAAGPLNTDGLAVTYKDNHSTFARVNSTTGAYTINNFIDGSFDPKGLVYVQRTP